MAQAHTEHAHEAGGRQRDRTSHHFARAQVCRESAGIHMDARADARIRTADPFITSEVLYQLSYVGGEA